VLVGAWKSPPAFPADIFPPPRAPVSTASLHLITIMIARGRAEGGRGAGKYALSGAGAQPAEEPRMGGATGRLRVSEPAAERRADAGRGLMDGWAPSASARAPGPS
jgi:hypothetical protein